jgi:hypothetical protein
VGTLIDGKLIKRMFTHIWVKCPDCGVERWSALNNMKHSKTGGKCAGCSCNDEIRRGRASNKQKLRYENPEEGLKTADCSREMWSRVGFKSEQVRKILKGNNAKPTKPENTILSLLDNLYPNEWKYVGDGEVILGADILPRLKS